MLRWGFSKNRKSSDDSPLPAIVTAGRRHSVTVSDDGLEGWMSWAEDPFFRPTIGVFADRALRYILKTTRAPEHGRLRAAEWRCAFSVKFEAGFVPNQLQLTCLESGEIIYETERPETPDEEPAFDVDDVIALAARRRKKWDASGFRSFLSLSLSDQVQILYLDILNRYGDPEGLSRYVERVLAGMTVLDIRDEMLASEEFWSQRGKGFSIEERVGQWVVWGGLTGVAPSVVSVPSQVPGVSPPAVAGPLLSAFEQLGHATAITDYLTRLTLGGGATNELRNSWQSAHADVIGGILAESERLRAARPSAYQPGSARMMISGMLSMMEVGSAGGRDRKTRTVRTRLGAEGPVVYGPYLRLEPGNYKLVVEISVAPAKQPAVSRRAGLAIEIVYGDLIVGWRDLSAPTEQDTCYPFEFGIPALADDFLTGPKFEFRIHSDGTREAEIKAVTLERLDEAGARPFPAVTDWMRLLMTGSAGEEMPVGTALRAKPGEQGHVVYGLYRSLLPGDYALAVSYEDADESVLDNGARVEVMTAGDLIVVSEEFVFASEKGRLELEFSVPAVASIDKLLGPLEIRVWKDSGAAFTITAVELTDRRAKA